MTQRVSSSTSIFAACTGVTYYEKVGFYDWNSYLEITVQHSLFVKVRHTLRDFVYHFQRVYSCCISVT